MTTFNEEQQEMTITERQTAIAREWRILSLKHGWELNDLLNHATERVAALENLNALQETALEVAHGNIEYYRGILDSYRFKPGGDDQ